MAFLDDYESVADRIDRFWTQHKDGRIMTDLVHRDDKSFIIKAMIWRNAASDNEWSGPDATGYAEEIVGSTNVNKTSALENCETSAIGRALANLGFAAKGQRPSREEMAKAAPTPRPRSGGRVSPSKPEPQESHTEAPKTNGNAVGDGNTTLLKRALLDAVNGDKPKAGMIWREVVGEFGYLPEDLIPDDMRNVIGEALKARVTT